MNEISNVNQEQSSFLPSQYTMPELRLIPSFHPVPPKGRGEDYTRYLFTEARMAYRPILRKGFPSFQEDGFSDWFSTNFPQILSDLGKLGQHSDRNLCQEVIQFVALTTLGVRRAASILVEDNWRLLQQHNPSLRYNSDMDRLQLKKLMNRQLSSELNLEVIKYMIEERDLLSFKFEIFTPQDGSVFLGRVGIPSTSIPENSLLLVVKVPDLFLHTTFRRKGGETLRRDVDWRRTAIDTPGVLETGQWYTTLLELFWSLRGALLTSRGVKVEKVSEHRVHSTGEDSTPEFYHIYICTS